MTTQHISIAIKATPAQVWNALIDATMTPAYYVGFTAEFDLTPGAPYRYTAGGGDMITGHVVAVEPGTSLTTTFNGFWDPEVAKLPESTVTFALGATAMPMPGVTLLSVTHEDLVDTPVAAGIETGWVTIVSGLKTLLETGAPMFVPAP